jgi:hypothetical protein
MGLLKVKSAIFICCQYTRVLCSNIYKILKMVKIHCSLAQQKWHRQCHVYEVMPSIYLLTVLVLTLDVAEVVC